MSAPDDARFSRPDSRTERSSASGAVVSTSGAAARSNARDGERARTLPDATPCAVSTDGQNDARTHAAPSMRARAAATSRTW